MTKRERHEDAHSPAVMGAALAAAEQPGATDAKVAERYGVVAGTISSWRSRMAEDAETAAAFQAALAVLAARWAPESVETLSIVCAEIRRRIADDPHSLKMGDLLGAYRALSEALIQHEALAGAADKKA